MNESYQAYRYPSTTSAMSRYHDDVAKSAKSTLRLDARTRRAALDRRRIDWQNVTLIDQGWVVAEVLWRAVVVEEAVVFPLDIVEFGIDVRRELRMPAEFVGEKLEGPAQSRFAVERADAAVLAVDQRSVLLSEPWT